MVIEPSHRVIDSCRREVGVFVATVLLSLVCGCEDLLDQPPGAPEIPADVQLAPMTCAGPDLQTLRATTVTLQAACSRTLSSDADLELVWLQSRGSRVTLQSAVSAEASFLAPFVPDELEFNLEATLDAVSTTDRARVRVVRSLDAVAPVAVAGGDVYTQGDTADLDASRSRAAGGELVAYRWRQVSGVYAVIETPGAARTLVTLPPAAESAAFAIEVQSEQGLWSEPDFVVVRRPGGEDDAPPPPTLTGPSYASPGEAVELVTSSRDPALSFDFSLRQLRGDPVALDLSDPERVRFVAPRRPQVIAFRLDVERDGLRAVPAIAFISVTAGFGNLAPVADAGPDRVVRPGQRLSLSADGSFDPDGEPLQTYAWAQTAGPTLALDCSSVRCDIDMPETAGQIGLSLVVGDGIAESNPAVVVIEVDPEASNSSPTADAGGERWGLPATEVILDGSRSDDPDSGTLASFRWRQLDDGAPRAQLGPADQATLSVTPTAQSGDLSFELMVCDAEEACASDVAVLHVEDAGPFVDATVGSADGNGTFASPMLTLSRGIEQAQRYGFTHIKIAAGRYQEAAPLKVPAELHVEGGLVRDATSYVAAAGATTTIAVPGVDAITLDNGSILERLSLESAVASSSISIRRLLVLGTQTALRDIEVTGPDSAARVVSVDILAGSRVDIDGLAVTGGDGTEVSTALRAGPSTDVEMTGFQVRVGAAARATGVASSHGLLRLESGDILTHTGSADGGELIGMDLFRAQASVSGVSVHLDASELEHPPQLAIGISCFRCDLDLSPSCVIAGGRDISNGGQSTGVWLYLSPAATLRGAITGGRASPTARLVGVEAFGGTIDVVGLDLVAAADGAAADAVGLLADASDLEITSTAIDAVGTDSGVGVMLTDTASASIQLIDLNVEADVARGVVDGFASDLVSEDSPSAMLLLDLLGPARVSGGADAIGLDLAGGDDIEVVANDLIVEGVEKAAGLRLQNAAQVVIAGSRISTSASGPAGEAVAVTCSAQDAATTLDISQSRLGAVASVASALEAGACDAAVQTTVFSADGSSASLGVSAAGHASINGAYIVVTGAASDAVHLASGAGMELLNSIVEMTPQGVALLHSEDSPDQWLALHHLILVPTTAPALAVGGAVVAYDAQTLNTLRPRFTGLTAVDDAYIDSNGHLTAAISAAVDNGDPLSATLVDIDGDMRPRGNGPDIGPDEF